ncbi:hypothetical protein RRG08_024727 [Elysia crispata]|uniref:Uncharacterized protein n=1 Tax=Elysia crispata TaxID=231223 RepID=A0AAE1CX06_9GAST|nr:hypothetical protein RRG08_024727 [Elysia crispata]
MLYRLSQLSGRSLHRLSDFDFSFYVISEQYHRLENIYRVSTVKDRISNNIITENTSFIHQFMQTAVNLTDLTKEPMNDFYGPKSAEECIEELGPMATVTGEGWKVRYDLYESRCGHGHGHPDQRAMVWPNIYNETCERVETRIVHTHYGPIW